MDFLLKSSSRRGDVSVPIVLIQLFWRPCRPWIGYSLNDHIKLLGVFFLLPSPHHDSRVTNDPFSDRWLQSPLPSCPLPADWAPPPPDAGQVPPMQLWSHHRPALIHHQHDHRRRTRELLSSVGVRCSRLYLRSACVYVYTLIYYAIESMSCPPYTGVCFCISVQSRALASCSSESQTTILLLAPHCRNRCL